MNDIIKLVLMIFLILCFCGCGANIDDSNYKENDLNKRNESENANIKKYEILDDFDFRMINTKIGELEGSRIIIIKSFQEYKFFLNKYSISLIDILKEDVDKEIYNFFEKNNLIIVKLLLGNNEKLLGLNRIDNDENNTNLYFDYTSSNNHKSNFECLCIRVDKEIELQNILINMKNVNENEYGSNYYKAINENVFIDLCIFGIDEEKLKLTTNSSYFYDEDSYKKEGYIFQGLYYDKEYKNKYNYFPLIDDTVLYAKYVKKNIEIELIDENDKVKILIPFDESIDLNKLSSENINDIEGLYYDSDFLNKYNGEKIKKSLTMYVKRNEISKVHICEGNVKYNTYNNVFSFGNLRKDIILISTYAELKNYLIKESFVEVTLPYVGAPNILTIFNEKFFENNCLIIGKQLNSDPKLHICGLSIDSNELVINIKNENEINEDIKYSTNCFILSINKEVIKEIADVRISVKK